MNLIPRKRLFFEDGNADKQWVFDLVIDRHWGQFDLIPRVDHGPNFQPLDGDKRGHDLGLCCLRCGMREKRKYACG